MCRSYAFRKILSVIIITENKFACHLDYYNSNSKMNTHPEKAIENALHILSFTPGDEPYSFANRLIAEKELSDLVINCLPGIFYVQDHTGKYLRWNQNFEKASGYSRAEIEKIHPLTFFDPSDHEKM